MYKNSDTDSTFECSQLQPGQSYLKDFIKFSITDCERAQKRQSST